MIRDEDGFAPLSSADRSGGRVSVADASWITDSLSAGGTFALVKDIKYSVTKPLTDVPCSAAWTRARLYTASGTDPFRRSSQQSDMRIQGPLPRVRSLNVDWKARWPQGRWCGQSIPVDKLPTS